MTLSTTLSTLWSWPALLAVLTVVFVLIRRKKDDDGNIPWATGAIPLLGHALAYKRDPATFITEQRKLVGDVFRLNLAGKRMIVVAGGAENVRAVAFASERRFSARAAVRDVTTRVSERQKQRRCHVSSVEAGRGQRSSRSAAKQSWLSRSR